MLHLVYVGAFQAEGRGITRMGKFGKKGVDDGKRKDVVFVCVCVFQLRFGHFGFSAQLTQTETENGGVQPNSPPFCSSILTTGVDESIPKKN